MGGHPWFYFTDYEPDVESALRKLRDREFAAGRYNPVVRFIKFPITSDSPAPGPRHKSIRDAVRSSAEDGTRSILDMESVSEVPDYHAVSPLAKRRLIELFATEQPTRDTIEASMDVFEQIERGQGIYIIVYKDAKPSEIFFAGYSFD